VLLIVVFKVLLIVKLEGVVLLIGTITTGC